MRVRIESDGTSNGTSIKNAETGEEIEHVIGVDIFVRINEPVVANITLYNVELDIIGDENDGAL